SRALNGVHVVHHLAGLIRAPGMREYRRVNVEGTLHMYRLFSDRPQAKRFVYCSSLAAAGPTAPGQVRDKEADGIPMTEYGRSKQEAEEGLGKIRGTPLTVIRPPAVYGPRDTAILMLFQIAHHGWFPVFGDKRRKISLVHVFDLVRGMGDAAVSSSGTGTFF